MTRLLLALALISASASLAPARAGDPQTQIALRVIDDYVVPRYQVFAAQTAAQSAAWSAYCQNTRKGDKAALQAAFNATADAWADVEHIRAGPVSLFLRAERIAYWPELRNATQRALAGLLASADAHSLEPQVFAGGSVAGQGLPALERLLYGDIDIAAPRACAVGLAIANNLAGIGTEIVASWTADNGPRALLAQGKKGEGGFTDGAEAARLLLTDLMTSFQRMIDMKLLAVLGDSADTAKPKAAEAWRAGRSARNLKRNLASTAAMIAVFAQDLAPSDMTAVDVALVKAQGALNAMPDDIGAAAADAGARPKIEAAANALKAARDATRATLPVKLNIVLGFNALDGD